MKSIKYLKLIWLAMMVLTTSGFKVIPKLEDPVDESDGDNAFDIIGPMTFLQGSGAFVPALIYDQNIRKPYRRPMLQPRKRFRLD
ncbi:hypothetical protein ACOME3_002116 [Neoechinorhynchus agilis]